MPFHNFKVPAYQHIFNIYLELCSCRALAARGQPHFCKHLYAIHAAQRNLTAPDQIFECCKQISPSLTPYQANIFQIQNPCEHFGYFQLDIVQKLIAQSHEATDTAQ